ncbi:MAG TPA: hypothetical protein VHS27_01515 [Gaiellales bacterium]|nr:hypothetical protein [Gaiellales bacterium]
MRGAHLGECWWFLVWAIVGGCLTISFVSVVGLFFLPVAALGALAGLWWGRADSATAPLGAITGAGVPLLLVAYLQRKGPGTVCWHTATASGCDDYLGPRPWLAIGLVLLLGGIGAFVAARRVR